MRRSIRFAAAALAVLVGSGLGGCDMIRNLRKPNPDVARAERLRVPPDLSTGGFNESMAVPGTVQNNASLGQQPLALPAVEGAKVHKVAGQRWLEIEATPDQVWKWLHDYLAKYGVKIAREDPKLGLVQTEWIFQPVSLPRGVFSPEITDPKDARVADYYVFRVEPGTRAGATDVYVAQRRLAAEGVGDKATWNWRPADPFLETEMLRGFLVHLGVSSRQATQQIAAAEGAPAQTQLDRGANGHVQLVVQDSFFNAWRRVGGAVDRLGFTLEDRNRSQGQYFVRYDPEAETGKPEKGLLDTLAFWRDEPPDRLGLYVIQLREDGARTVVTVDKEGGDPAPDEVAERILALLAEQLR